LPSLSEWEEINTLIWPGLTELPAIGWRASDSRELVAAAPSNAVVFMSSSKSSAEFERIFLPHLDAAYNLARMLMRNVHDAEDVVQESYLKALRAFPSFRGEASRPWFLTIVRNTSFTRLRDNRAHAASAEFHEELQVSRGDTPEAESLGLERAREVERCVRQLPPDFQEAIVLREMEELSYREISEITGVPPGTVMSRLSRARARLAECLKNSGAGSLFPAGSGHELR
jgi:RNA polymerase sigma-70 factor (ECF subfamily)